jgi:hypothetical protein
MNEDHAHAELLAFLNHTWEDIERTKQRQWSDFYHLLIAQGAIVGLGVAWNPPTFWLLGLFATAIFLLTILGIGIVLNSQKALHQQRCLVDELYTLINHEAVRNILAGNLAESRGRLPYPRLYIALLVGSGLFALLIIFSFWN